MPKAPRIFNTTRKFHMSLTRALRGMENGAWTWEVEGETVRNLTPLESWSFNKEQATMREPLPYSEIPGLKYQGPIPHNYELDRAAHEFVTSGV